MLLIAALLFAAQTAATAPPPARLCVAPVGETVDALSSCREVNGREIVVSAAAEPRVVLWTSGDGSEGTMATLAGGETKIDVDALRRVTLSLGGGEDDVWPAAVRIEATTTDGKRWSARLPANVAAALRVLRVPKDVRELRFAAAHHAEKNVPVADKLGAIILRRFPVIAGRVNDGVGGGPLFAAMVMTNTNVTAKSDAAGEFRIEIVRDWPKTLEVTFPGRAASIVDVPPSPHALTLPPIVMRRGGSLRLGLVHDGAVTLELLRASGDDERTIAKRSIAADESELVLRDLAEGTYRLRLRGSGPLEQYGTTVRIEDGAEAQLDLLLKATPLELLVRHGGRSVPSADVEVMNAGGKWSGKLRTDDEGRASATLWQGGDFGVAIRAFQPLVSYIGHRRGEAGERLSWTIDVPSRRVYGRVIEAGTRNAVPTAEVALEVRTERGDGMMLRGQIDASGAFEIPSVPAGNHTVMASAEGYLPANASFTLTDDDHDRNVTLELERAVIVPVSVIDARGAVLANASIFDASSPNGWTTDASGEARIALRRGETKTLFIIPREGSFAVAHVAAGAGAARIQVPVGAATIRLTADAADNGVLPTINLDTRYNGEPIPPHVVDAFLHVQGNLFRVTRGLGTLTQMPTGVYEFAPRIAKQSAAAAPVRVAAQPGENVVTMTFAR